MDSHIFITLSDDSSSPTRTTCVRSQRYDLCSTRLMIKLILSELSKVDIVCDAVKSITQVTKQCVNQTRCSARPRTFFKVRLWQALQNACEGIIPNVQAHSNLHYADGTVLIPESFTTTFGQNMFQGKAVNKMTLKRQMLIQKIWFPVKSQKLIFLPRIFPTLKIQCRTDSIFTYSNRSEITAE